MNAIRTPMKAGRGVVIIEREDGTTILEFAENSRVIFASPIHETREFASFGAAINFLAMYERIGQARWWDHPLETAHVLEAS